MYKENVIVIPIEELKDILFEYIKKNKILADEPNFVQLKYLLNENRFYAIEYKWTESYIE